MPEGLGLYKADETALSDIQKWCKTNNLKFPSDANIVDRVFIRDVAVLEQVTTCIEAFKKARVRGNTTYAKCTKGQWVLGFLPELYRLRDHSVEVTELGELKEGKIDHRAMREAYIKEIIRHKRRRAKEGRKILVEELQTFVKRGLKLKEDCPRELFREYRKEAESRLEAEAPKSPTNSPSQSTPSKEPKGSERKLEAYKRETLDQWMANISSRYRVDENGRKLLVEASTLFWTSTPRSAKETIRVGYLFREIQSILYYDTPIAQWLNMVGVSHCTARECELSYEAFGLPWPRNADVWDKYQVSAMYLLGRLKNEKAAKESLKLARNGTFITAKVAQRLVNEQDDGSEVTNSSEFEGPKKLVGKVENPEESKNLPSQEAVVESPSEVTKIGHLIQKILNPVLINRLAAQHPEAFKQDTNTIIEMLQRWKKELELEVQGDEKKGNSLPAI